MDKNKKIRKMKISLLASSIVFFMIFSICFTKAATIHGKVYDSNLDLVYKAIVEVNSTPKQSIVANDGTYSFIVPQGTYEIEAFYTFQGTLLYDKETITVPQEGTFTLDLILFETPDIEDMAFDESDLNLIEGLLKEKKGTDWALIMEIIIGILIIAAILFFIIRKRRKGKIKRNRKKKFRAKAVELKEEKPIGDEALKRTLDILKREKRVTQKDIRKELGISEAKASLIIADLEAQGKVRKIKRGRGNIIILTSE